MTSNATVALAAVIGVAFGLAIVILARRGSLSMRYTLGWLFVAACVVAAGVFGRLIEPLASRLDIDPAVLLLGFASLALLSLTVQLSITVSGLTERVRTLAEAQAILRQRVDQLTDDGKANGADRSRVAQELAE